jgi:hypothetical protein
MDYFYRQENITHCTVGEFPTVLTLKERLKTKNGIMIYQGINVTSFDIQRTDELLNGYVDQNLVLVMVLLKLWEIRS